MTRETITLHARDSHVYDGTADGDVSPGELLELTGRDGQERTFGAHSGEAEPAAPRFAKEYSHTGMSIDDDYANDDHLEYRRGLPGDEYLAYLDAGESVSEDDSLVSAGNGALKLAAADGTEDAGVVAKAIEEVDNGAGAEPVRVEIEVV